MREIKFRAWDGYRNQFGQMWLNNDNGKLESAPGVTIEQFTGLKDKNGKEIYEGDIVEFPSSENVFIEIHYTNYGLGEPPERMRSEIKWIEAGFTFQWENGYEGAEVSWDTLEVIGNIHENSDLLVNPKH